MDRIVPITEHFDVLIIGAGLSGIGAACRLTTALPGKTYAILEAREVSGGTWDLFRYPGIRSDSDMFTMGYGFRPWTEPTSIADGASILNYIRETAREYGVDRKIRYQHRVVRASWSSPQARWKVEVHRDDLPEPTFLTCDFLFTNTGYYRYDRGYTPDFEGVEQFAGQIVHPQHWPADLDHAGRKIVVIGSGATTVTLVPALAREAAHVTMLQRSPSYVISLPTRDPLAERLFARLPRRPAAAIVRWKSIVLTTLMYQFSRRAPARVAAALRARVRQRLPEGYPVDTHFAPRYKPWDQRLCVVPDGDLFAAIRDGRADVVTDQIETFTPHGIRLAGGTELEADIVVTATGLSLSMLGGIKLEVDGHPIELPEVVGYQGIMFSGVPNYALTVGYTNASWTLKADLASGYVCRVLKYMEQHGFRQCTPLAPPPGEQTRPLIDLTSGYVQRAAAGMPRQGRRNPWRVRQNYPLDLVALKYGPITGRTLEFA
jgi:cation diffusion facilitator CzcD-associated flavoprotein CzcO